MSKVVTILSIDGGGIRGIIPAIVLAEIERRLNRPISSIFNIVAGTSTGGILAVGLSKPGEHGSPQYSARDLVSLYTEYGNTIFSRPWWFKLRSLWGLVEEKYLADPFEKLLVEKFGDTRFKDSLTNTIIPCYETEDAFPFFFKSHRAKSEEGYDFPMRDVVRSTTAAPTYFEPHQVKASFGDKIYSQVDGGVFANNPAMCAYVEALKLYPEADSCIMISLGTGMTHRKLPFKKIKRWGLVNWARPILDVVFDGISDTVDYQLGRILNDPDRNIRNYYRFQVSLEGGNSQLDNVSPENIHTLQMLGKELVLNKKQDLDEITLRLKDQQFEQIPPLDR
jgi:patatin-like phospholipase/acyl hydrolase